MTEEQIEFVCRRCDKQFFLLSSQLNQFVKLNSNEGMVCPYCGVHVKQGGKLK